jgi:hypothetical protein
MLGENKSRMQCAEFDALLTEAIDGGLSGDSRVRFEQHGSSCESCATLWAEVRSGVQWLDELEDVAPPQMLVHNILAATSAAVQAAPAMPRLSPGQRLRQRLHGFFAPVLTPRFGMSMGMAFFSITLLLNMAQIKIRDLTPHNLSHTFYSSQNRFMKYYENMRLVYEIESRVRDLRNSDEENQRERQRQREERNDLRQQQDKSHRQAPEQNEKSEPEGPRRREYSRDESLLHFAGQRRDSAPLNIYFADLAMQRREL